MRMVFGLGTLITTLGGGHPGQMKFFLTFIYIISLKVNTDGACLKTLIRPPVFTNILPKNGR